MHPIRVLKFPLQCVRNQLIKVPADSVPRSVGYQFVEQPAGYVLPPGKQPFVLKDAVKVVAVVAAASALEAIQLAEDEDGAGGPIVDAQVTNMIYVNDAIPAGVMFAGFKEAKADKVKQPVIWFETPHTFGVLCVTPPCTVDWNILALPTGAEETVPEAAQFVGTLQSEGKDGSPAVFHMYAWKV
jgi:hypothetical protein